MKTQNQKRDDRFSKRIARWWSKFVEWAEDADVEEICTNIFVILIIAGVFFGFIYAGVHNSHKSKTENSTVDTAAVVEKRIVVIQKQDKINWDIDTVTVLAPNEKGYKLHFKGKVPYYLTIENLDSIQ